MTRSSLLPIHPPNVVCDNKECGWIGKSEDRVEDEEFDSHCPSCNGTDFSWIDYNPDTKEGRTNRAKFCKPWDPVESLDRIIEEFNNVEEVATKPKWPF